jgi:hypothetical protein
MLLSLRRIAVVLAEAVAFGVASIPCAFSKPYPFEN